jgi:hypothetical protein
VRQVRIGHLFLRETGQDKPSLLQGDRSGQAISSLDRRIMTGHLFITETGQERTHIPLLDRPGQVTYFSLWRQARKSTSSIQRQVSDKPSLHKGDWSGQVISSSGRQVREKPYLH